jgi:hypothetical protein
MSIIQQHTSASLSESWRTINIDALMEDSSQNFDVSTLHPPLPETSEAEVRQLAGQVRQLLRGGDAEGALRGCLESPVYNGDHLAKVGYFQSPETVDVGILNLVIVTLLGITSPDRHRGPPIHQSERHDAHAPADLQRTRRQRMSGRAHEISVSLSEPKFPVCKLQQELMGLRAQVQGHGLSLRGCRKRSPDADEGHATTNGL